MAKYRKVDVKIWNDQKFNNLSLQGKMAFLFILTHPSLTPLGAMRATKEGLCQELNGVSIKAFQEVFREGFVKYDAKAFFIWLPNFLKYNKPESPNVIKSWCKSWDDLPECSLKDELLEKLKDFIKALPKAFQEAFTESFPKGMPNQ